MWTLRLTVLAFTLITLSSCAPFGFNDRRAGVCNQLNSQMIFNGGTSNTRDAEIQMAQQPLIQKTYDADNCNEPPSNKRDMMG